MYNPNYGLMSQGSANLANATAGLGQQLGGGIQALGQGYALGQQREQQATQQAQMQELVKSAMSGNQEALSQVNGINPELGMKIQEQLTTQQGDKQLELDKNALEAMKLYHSTPPEQKDEVFARLEADPNLDIDAADRALFDNPNELRADITEVYGKDVADAYFSGQGSSLDTVQSSSILDDGTVIQVTKQGNRKVISPEGDVVDGVDAKEIISNSKRKAHERKVELKILDQLIKTEQAKESVMTQQQKEIQRGNIQRLGLLSSTSTGRDSAIRKANKFKTALQEGQANSGAGRRGAQFIPGVFTSQGQFDEEFNAFAEVAARQQLKASGETRPTDADVQGMKQAMFGVGRDEDVNIQLLDDFIKDQIQQNSELDQLIDASRTGNLSGFTYVPTNDSPKGDFQIMEDANGNRAKVYADGTIEEL